ncbi:MAG: MCE family protein [Rhodospirillales bacterium]|nr:MCE family protein [Rhodospirillales bacterium]
MTSETREILIGAGAFGCLLLVLAYLYGGRDWREARASTGTSGHKMVVAKFNRVDGLVEGDDVMVGGIRVGTVSRMTLDDRYRAVITMKIFGDVPLPTDTSAAIHTDGLFGSKFLVLEPGGDQVMLKTGGEIAFTQDSVVVCDLLELIIAEGRAALAERRRDADKAEKTKSKQ